MPLDLSRRSLIRGLGATLIAAPAIVRAGSLMPVKKMIISEPLYGRSPMMDALPDMREIQERIKRALDLELAAQQNIRALSLLPPWPWKVQWGAHEI